MSYESPIGVITSQLRISSETYLGNEVIKAVQKVGVNDNKAELLKALAYDRDQYEKGYADRDKQIIRCKDCGFGYPLDGIYVHCTKPFSSENHMMDWHCADGRKKAGEQE